MIITPKYMQLRKNKLYFLLDSEKNFTFAHCF